LIKYFQRFRDFLFYKLLVTIVGDSSESEKKKVMQSITIVERYFKARYLFFKWRHSLSLVNKAVLALGIACLTGLVAQIRIFLPWTPVPITGQTFAVLLAGVLLGRGWGGISQAMYVVMGVAGIPWFANFSRGYSVLFGPTGGYLIGFILAALFIGYFTDKYIRARSFLPMFGLMLFANFVLIHGPGLLQLELWFYITKTTKLTLCKLLKIGTLPFIVGDIIKITVAAALAKAITPKESYNGEVDVHKLKK